MIGTAVPMEESSTAEADIMARDRWRLFTTWSMLTTRKLYFICGIEGLVVSFCICILPLGIIMIYDQLETRSLACYSKMGADRLVLISRCPLGRLTQLGPAELGENIDGSLWK
jgi:hypothetical protein